MIGKIFKDKEELDLTGGDIKKNLFYLSLPIVLLNLLRTTYNIVDMFWLGQLSKEALAAITFSFPIIFLLVSLGIGLAVAGSVLVAQNEGAGREEQVKKAASQTVTFSFLTSFLIGGVGFFFSRTILEIMGAAPEVASMGTSYLQIISLGIFSMFGFSVFIALMRGYGDTITPMLLMLGTVILNMILDPFLIFGWSIFPQMGMSGAALATIFSRFMAFTAGLYILYTGYEGLQITPSRMVPDPEYFRKMVMIGVPASAESIGTSLSVNILMVVVGMFSTTVVAGFGIGIRIFSLVFLPAIAVGKGVETMVGQNIGAGNFARAEETNFDASKYMFLLLSLLGVILYFNAGKVASVFTKNTGVVDVAKKFIIYIIPAFGLTGIFHVMRGGFRGAGKTIEAAVITIITMGIVRVPVAYLLSRRIGTEGIYLSFVISGVIGATVAYFWWMKGSWKEKAIEE